MRPVYYETPDEEYNRAAWEMAADEVMLGKASEKDESYARLYTFDEPCFVLSRGADRSDALPGYLNGFDISRRNTAGSTIPLTDSCLAYSVAEPTDRFPDRYFSEEAAPALIDALESSGVEPGSLYYSADDHSVRYAGGTIAGSSLWRSGDSILCHGVIALEPWDAELLDRNMELRQGEKYFVGQLPSVEGVGGNPGKVEEELASALSLGQSESFGLPSEEISSLVDSKYDDFEWLNRGNQSDIGHCFVQQGEEGFY